MDKTYISQKITRFITLLSPLLIFTLKDQSYMVFVIPIFSAMVELFLDIYFDRKTFTEKIKDLMSIAIIKNSYSYSSDDPYHIISWYVEKECKTDKLSLKSFYKKCFWEVSKNKIPLYDIDNNLETEIMYNNEPIFIHANIVLGKDSMEKITLYAKSIDILKEFVFMCTDKYCIHIEQQSY